MPITIREATAADTDALSPLILAALSEQAQAAPHRYTPTADFALQFRRWLGKLFEDPRTTTLIAVPTAALRAADPAILSAPSAPLPPNIPILGFLIASVQDSPPMFHPLEYALIHYLYVLPDHRRRGAARLLVTAAGKFYHAHDIPQLRVETHFHNTPAQHFFESLGFHLSTLSLSRNLPLPPNSTPAKK